MLAPILFMWFCIGSIEVPRPAAFIIKTDAECTIFVGGMKVAPNKIYKTQPITEDVKIKIVVKYIHGEEICVEEGWMVVSPGELSTMLIEIKAWPRIVQC